jgi:hypothetical protein
MCHHLLDLADERPNAAAVRGPGSFSELIFDRACERQKFRLAALDLTLIPTGPAQPP